jgi:hypothetical protein
MSGIKECDKMVTIFDSTNCSNGKDFKDKLFKTTQANVLAQFYSTRAEDRVIFVDELDALLSIDRSFLTTFKDITLPKNIKVVLACTPDIAKKFMIPHKLITLNAAGEADILLALKSLKSGDRVKNLLAAAEASEGNIARALNHLTIATKRVKTCTDMTLGAVYRNPSIAFQVFTVDQWLNPLRFHENLLHELQQRVKPRMSNIKENTYTSIMHDMCLWDVMMSHGGQTDYIATHYIAQATRRLEILNVKRTAEAPASEFTKLINMLSVRKKGINGLYCSIFPWYQVGVYEKTFLLRK